MAKSPYGQGSVGGNLALDTRREIERFNARMRHFHGISLSVIADAENLWVEIWQACQDPRTPEEIIDGVELSEGAIPACGWPELKEKLHLLGHYLDYARRLLGGSMEQDHNSDKEERL